MSKGRLKTCMKLLTGVCVVFLYSALGGTSWAEDEGVAQMKQELRALKAELEALRGEMKSDKDSIKAHDDELLASKQEFSQLSSEVRSWKANPEAVETMKDQIKKELGFVPNVYNEMANKIRLGMELRTRGEFSNNWHALATHMSDNSATFSDSLNPGGGATTVTRGGGVAEDTFEVLNRARFNIDADVHEHLRAFVQFQDSRIWGIEGKSGDSALHPVGNNLDDPNRGVDIHQAYMDVRKFLNPNLTVRVGRQEIKWGTPGPGDPGDRLIGDFGWSNIGNAFDAIRVMWDTERYGAETFASVLRKRELAAASSVNRLDEDRNLFGGKFTIKKLIPKNTTELMYLSDVDNQEAATPEIIRATGETIARDKWNLSVHDVGFRTVGKIGEPIDYFAEYHYQVGDFRGRAHEAMAGVLGGGYTLSKVMWKPRFGYEFDWSPGDPSPANGKHRTFYNFYPTNHALYGYADLMSWKNMQAHKFSIKTFPTKKLTAWVDFWTFKKDQGKDAWYAATQAIMPGQGVSRTDRTTNLGKEIDFTLNYSLYKNVGILSGYSKVLPGAAIVESSTAKQDDTDWGFLQLTVSF